MKTGERKKGKEVGRQHWGCRPNYLDDRCVAVKSEVCVNNYPENIQGYLTKQARACLSGCVCTCTLPLTGCDLQQHAGSHSCKRVNACYHLTASLNYRPPNRTCV